ATHARAGVGDVTEHSLAGAPKVGDLVVHGWSVRAAGGPALLPAEEARDLQILGVIGSARRGRRHAHGALRPDAGHRGGPLIGIRAFRSIALALRLGRLVTLALQLLEEVAFARLLADGWARLETVGAAMGGRLATAGLATAVAVESRGDDGDHHLVAQPLVEAGSEDDVRLGIGVGADFFGRLR